MSSFSAPRDPFRRPFRAGGGGGRPRALLPTLIILAALAIAFIVSVNVWTEWMWFQAIDYRSVFTKSLLSRVGLFAGFGLLMALAVLVNLAIVYRCRPRYRAMSAEQQSLDRYRELLEPRRILIAVILATIIGLFAGSSAAGQWSTFLKWQNSTPFGQKDPQFNMDPAFWVFEYPWYRYVLSFGFAVLIVSLLVAVVAHYLYGGIRLQTPGQKASSAAQAHLSVLLGLFVALKAVAYWFDRYALVLEDQQVGGQNFTGMTYTDSNALLQAKLILVIIAAICALLFFANVVRRTWLLPGIGVGLLVLSSVLLGWVWPALVQQVQVNPNEADREAKYIDRNINATRSAYDIGDAKVDPEWEATTRPTQGLLEQDAQTIPGIRLVDPSVVGRTFEQLQQVRGFYSFSDILDVDRYNVEGEGVQDTVLGVREVNLEGLSQDQRNWTNDHTVYTHGYGVVAAYGNRRGAEGNPEWSEASDPPTSRLGKYEPRIYYGENSPLYSIVGRESGGPAVEQDLPGSDSNDEGSKYTYTGKGGVPVGSFLQRALYAAKFQEPNMLLNRTRINDDSKILYDRSPRERVEKVAPWLTPDADPYPAIVDGRVQWIVDAYTTTDSYPFSQRVDLDQATSDTTTQRQSIAAQPSERVNYMRNSVKATVDAYDGTVKLYQWDKDDPVLKTWMNVFPGSVEPKSKISDGLMDHLRYPQDIFKVQREILTRYHVTDPHTFYSGDERWKVPDDPNNRDRKQPPYYLSVRMPGQDEPRFSLTAPYIFFNRENLSAFAAVNGDAQSDDYGTMRVIEPKPRIDGPSQIANKMDSENSVADRLLKFSRGDNTVVKGNLLTLPVGGGLLYVQPVYVERKQGSAYPLLRLVVASFGGNIGVGTSLDDALDQVFQGDSGADTGEDGESDSDPGETPPGGGGGGEPSSPEVQQALNEANQAFARADKALKDGDLETYGAAMKKAKAAVQRAINLQEQADNGAGGSDGGNGGSGDGSGEAGGGAGGEGSEGEGAADSGNAGGG